MDIGSLLDSLGEDDMKKLKETAAKFFGEKDGSPAAGSPSVPSSPAIDPKMITSVAKFSALLNERDPRSDFIMALKPLLSEPRRKKADDAAMMLKFLKIIAAAEGER